MTAPWHYLWLNEEHIVNTDKKFKVSESNNVTKILHFGTRMGRRMVQGMVTHACYPSPRQVETTGLRRSGFQGYLQLHNDFTVSLGNGDTVSQLRRRKTLKWAIGKNQLKKLWCEVQQQKKTAKVEIKKRLPKWRAKTSCRINWWNQMKMIVDLCTWSHWEEGSIEPLGNLWSVGALIKVMAEVKLS